MIVFLRNLLVASSVLPVLPAIAGSNQVFLGQTGDTNTIAVDQIGSANLVGGDTADLRLSQLGHRNTLTILQVGEHNGVGRSSMSGEFGFLTGRIGIASGLFQIGDGNELDVVQRTHRGDAGNLVGAVRQDAEAPSAGAANRATIRQTGGLYDPLLSPLGTSSGPGFHTIGEIAQTYRSESGAEDANVIEVEQSGLRQAAEQLRQDGSGNRLALAQSVEENSARLLDQTGSANRLSVDLSGTMNTLGNAVQFGAGHAAEIAVEGSGNLVEQVLQAGLGGLPGAGNTASISVIGDDNGGEGIGGYRAVSAQGTVLAAFAASLEQYGERNGFRLTIGSRDGRADGNGFSANQTGADNQAAAVLAGDANLVSLFQIGDGNVLDLTQTSTVMRGARADVTGNQALVIQAGDGNRVGALQSGAGNRLDLRIEGDRNMGTGTPAGLKVASGSPFGVGLAQRGEGHLATLDVRGDGNGFALMQTGMGHVADGAIQGQGNTAVVLQAGSGHVAVFRQFGDRNYTFIQQR